MYNGFYQVCSKKPQHGKTFWSKHKAKYCFLWLHVWLIISMKNVGSSAEWTSSLCLFQKGFRFAGLMHAIEDCCVNQIFHLKELPCKRKIPYWLNNSCKYYSQFLFDGFLFFVVFSFLKQDWYVKWNIKGFSFFPVLDRIGQTFSHLGKGIKLFQLQLVYLTCRYVLSPVFKLLPDRFSEKFGKIFL